MGRGENQLGLGCLVCGRLLLLRGLGCRGLSSLCGQGCRLGEGWGQGWGQAQG